MTAPDNPFFARAAVNRAVGALLRHRPRRSGRRPAATTTRPSHPELLDELARQFAAHEFDLKFLIRAITAEQDLPAHQRRRRPEPGRPAPVRPHAGQGADAEQLFDSLVEATGYRERRRPTPRASSRGQLAARPSSSRKFANRSDKRTEYQTSILQALTLMNGKFVADATSLEQSVTLAGVADAPFMDTAEQGRDAVPGHPVPQADAGRGAGNASVTYVERGGARRRPEARRWPTSSGRCSTAASSF